MNIHHLELFYYVARFGGIAEAVRRMPYGIQQPAISSQVIQLESSLGVTLFRRRPFALTSAGAELFAFIRPFFDNLDTVAEQLRGGISQHLRIGAAETVLRDHLPGVLQAVRQQFPKLTVSLREGYQYQIEQWLTAQEIDLAVTLIEQRTAPGVKVLELVALPLALLVPKRCRYRAASELWQQDKIEETLISLPVAESIPKSFHDALRRRGLDWFTGIEVSSMDLIEAYVAHGYGIGLTIHVPKARHDPRLRVLPLDDFPKLQVGAMWSGRLTPLTQAVLDAMRAAATRLLAG